MIKTHASLFSGIGGAEIAATWMGWDNVFHCEINPFGRKILEYWYPNSKSYEDITKTDFTIWRGNIGILTGGFPCQPFSVAGARKGADDDRYLWPEMLLAIREIQPSWVVGENVNGIITMVQPGSEVEVGRTDDIFEENHIYRKEQEYVIETVCKDLEREGYSVQPIVIPACAVGAPHRRDRVWFVAHRTDARTETVQQERQDGVLPIGAVADTDGERLEGCARAKQTAKVFTGYGKEIITDPDVNGDTAQKASERTERGRWGDIPQQGEWGDETKWPAGLHGFSRPVAHTDSTGRQEYDYSGKSEEKASASGRDRQNVPDWGKFPTQPPVCGRDDGLSLGLAGISFPKWRAEAVKALGNAWVPQVAYEIFKAIEEVERENDDTEQNN